MADDSGALQAALTALANAGGGELEISPGIYRIASPVSVNYAGKASTIIIRGRGSATQILIATGAAATAITVQNLASALIDNVTFVGTPRSAAHPTGVPTDALVALRFDSTLQALLRRCDFYGLSSYVAGGAVVLANDSYLRIEDSAFRGCGASAGIQTSVVTNQNWHGLAIVNTDFIDYGYLYNWSGGSPPGFFGKTAIAPPFAWVALLDASNTPSGAPTNQAAALVNNVTFDEGAKYGLACLPSASSGRIESLTVTGLRVNEAGFGVPNDGLTIQGVDHVLIERSWFGYSPPSSPYSERNMISLRNVPDAVVDACRGDGNADIIVADATVGALTVRETVYRKLLSDAATTKVVQAGLEARLLKADGAIPANSLVVAAANPQRVVLAPAGAPASAILGVALDATASPGDRTRVVLVRGSIVPVAERRVDGHRPRGRRRTVGGRAGHGHGRRLRRPHRTGPLGRPGRLAGHRHHRAPRRPGRRARGRGGHPPGRLDQPRRLRPRQLRKDGREPGRAGGRGHRRPDRRPARSSSRSRPATVRPQPSSSPSPRAAATARSW